MTYQTYSTEEPREQAQAKRYELDATLQAGVQALLTELRQGKSEWLGACVMSCKISSLELKRNLTRRAVTQVCRCV